MPADHRPRILIADDEPAVLEGFESVLRRDRSLDHSSKAEADLEAELFGGPVDDDPINFDLTLCRQGEEAVDAVRNSIETNTPFEMAFLDVRMPPGISGIEAAQEIRALDLNINIVFVTGFSDIHPHEIRKRVPPVDKYLFYQKPLKNIELEQLARTLSARWESDAALKSTSLRLEHLLGSSSAVIYSCVLGGDFQATFVSENIKHLLGYETREFLDDPGFWLNHIHPDDKPRLNGELEKTLRGENALAEYRFQRKDGGYTWLRDGATAVLDGDGKPAELVGYAVDITDRKQAEQERDRALEQLHQAQKLESLGTLAGGIAHDFNNILGIIIGFADIVADDLPRDSAQRANVLKIAKAANRGATLVSQILAYARKTETVRKPLRLDLSLHESLAMLRSTLPTTVQIDDDIPDGISPIIANQAQIHQVLTNLFVNSVHAIGGAPGLIRVNCAELTPGDDDSDTLRQLMAANTPDAMVIEERANGRGGVLSLGRMSACRLVRLTVEDDGCGMDHATLARSFEPFFTTKAVGDGTGLGLASVSGIVLSHGGAIVVDTLRDRGTRFEIYLPTATDETSPPQTNDADSGNGQPDQLAATVA